MDVQFEPCVIERLMGIDSRWKPPTEKYRVFSDKYLQKMCSMGMRSQRDNKNRLSWMETDGSEPDSSNSCHCKANEIGWADECERSSVPYSNECSGYCPSTFDGEICHYPAENDTMKKNAMERQLDSFRLIKSLQDYLAGNIRKRHTVDNERKSSNVDNPQSFRIRRRIYMDPQKEVAAHTRHVKEIMKCSSSGLGDFSATPLLLPSHIDNQRMRYNTPSSYYNDPCLRAMQALKDSRKTSKVSRYDRISFITSRTCIDKLHPNLSTQMTLQKTRSDIAFSVSTSPHSKRLTDAVDQVASAVTHCRVNHQESMHALPGIVFDHTLLIPETLSPRSLKEACQHSPVSVLQSSSNAGVGSDFDHLKQVRAELQELKMHLQQLETELPEGFSESSVTGFSHKEINQEEVRALLSILKQEAIKTMNLTGKDLVSDSRWLDLEEEINAIGIEVESLLIDELIQDFICT